MANTLYGKFFASTFDGSMYGAGPDVFALWGYVIANCADSMVELNVDKLAATLGSTAEKVQAAIDYLCKPDPRSRNPEEGGRRLIKTGSFQYHVTTFNHYRSIRNSQDVREYNKIKMRESRERRKAEAARVKGSQPESEGNVNDVNTGQAMCRQSESESEAEAPEEQDPKNLGLVLPGDEDPGFLATQESNPVNGDEPVNDWTWAAEPDGKRPPPVTRNLSINVNGSQELSNSVNDKKVDTPLTPTPIDTPRQGGAGIRPVNPASGEAAPEWGTVTWLFHELSQPVDFATRDLATQALRGLVSEGRSLEDAAEYLRQRGLASIAENVPINRWWFSNRLYDIGRKKALPVSARLKYKEN